MSLVTSDPERLRRKLDRRTRRLGEARRLASRRFRHARRLGTARLRACAPRRHDRPRLRRWPIADWNGGGTVRACMARLLHAAQLKDSRTLVARRPPFYEPT